MSISVNLFPDKLNAWLQVFIQIVPEDFQKLSASDLEIDLRDNASKSDLELKVNGSTNKVAPTSPEVEVHDSD